MPKLIANERFYYAGRNVEMDEEFDADEVDVSLLTHMVKPMARQADSAPPEGEVPNPSLNSINPSSARVDAGLVTFNATGTRFYAGSKIAFGGDFILTEFVNTGKLIGTIDTINFGEGNYLVHVDNEGSLSENKTFTITAAAVKNTDKDAAPRYKRRDMKAGG